MEGTPPESLRARAVVELKRDVTVSGRAVIVARRPDLFRIEVFGPFNTSAATLLSDGTNLTVFSEGRLDTYGWDDPDLPYLFSAEEVVRLLTGAWTEDAARKGEDGFRYASEYDPATGTFRVVKLYGAFEALRADLSDWKDVDGRTIPFRISIDDGKQSINIQYFSVDIEPEISAGTFGGRPRP